MASNTDGVGSLMGTKLGVDNSSRSVNPKTDININPPKKVETESDYSNVKTSLAGAKFMLDVMNANSQYSTIKGQAQLNIMQARNSAADALYRGRQAQRDAQSEGDQAGQQALLNAAAQGQDVNGEGTRYVQSSYEVMGIMDGMREEINGMREALGYELEEINYDYQVAQAGIQHRNALIGSALNFGATALSAKA
jgi:hypothetical protein